MEQEEGHSQSMPFFTLDMYQKKLSRDNLDNENWKGEAYDRIYKCFEIL